MGTFLGRIVRSAVFGRSIGDPLHPVLIYLLPRLPICSDTPHFYPCFVPSFSSINSKFGFNSGENIKRTSHGWKKKHTERAITLEGNYSNLKIKELINSELSLSITLSKVHSWKLIYIKKFIQIQELIVYIAEFSKCKIDNS